MGHTFHFTECLNILSPAKSKSAYLGLHKFNNCFNIHHFNAVFNCLSSDFFIFSVVIYSLPHTRKYKLSSVPLFWEIYIFWWQTNWAEISVMRRKALKNWIFFLGNNLVLVKWGFRNLCIRKRGHPSIPLVAPKRVLSAPNSPLKFCQNFDQKRNSSGFGLLCSHFSTNMQVSYHFGKLRPSPLWYWSPFEWKVNDQWEISSWK